MIPKRIFYCWFGHGEKSELNKRCIESWHKYCPDYEIIEINEDNFDYSKYKYSRIAYENGNWSFVSDIARVETLKDQGGFYLDTDVELFQSLDYMRNNNAVIAEMAYGFYCCHILGCDSHSIPEVYLSAYERLSEGTAYHVLLNEECYKKYNLLGDCYKREDDITFYGVEYVANTRTPVTTSTIAKHWEENSWVDSWKGGFTCRADFIPFSIYREGILDTEETEKWFTDVPQGNILYTYGGREIDLDLMEMGNYFYNPYVVSVQGEGFAFVRGEDYIPKEKHLENGCTLYYIR